MAISVRNQKATEKIEKLNGCHLEIAGCILLAVFIISGLCRVIKEIVKVHTDITHSFFKYDFHKAEVDAIWRMHTAVSAVPKWTESAFGNFDLQSYEFSIIDFRESEIIIYIINRPCLFV